MSQAEISKASTIDDMSSVPDGENAPQFARKFRLISRTSEPFCLLDSKKAWIFFASIEEVASAPRAILRAIQEMRPEEQASAPGGSAIRETAKPSTASPMYRIVCNQALSRCNRWDWAAVSGFSAASRTQKLSIAEASIAKDVYSSASPSPTPRTFERFTLAKRRASSLGMRSKADSGSASAWLVRYFGQCGLSEGSLG